MISIKTKKDIDLMREGGIILASVLKKLESEVRVGISPLEIDDIAHTLIVKSKARPAFLGMYGFPNTACISVNDEVVHGVPNKRKLVYGDLVSIDIGLVWGGWYLDMASTVPVIDGKSFEEWQIEDVSGSKLIKATKESLDIAISLCRPGTHLGDIGSAIDKRVSTDGFRVVRELAGHGIGHKLHEDPLVLNFGRKNEGVVLKPGMTIAIEPIVVEGRDKIRLKDDGHTYISMDGRRACHFEHTVAITDGDPIVLTA